MDFPGKTGVFGQIYKNVTFASYSSGYASPGFQTGGSFFCAAYASIRTRRQTAGSPTDGQMGAATNGQEGIGMNGNLQRFAQAPASPPEEKGAARAEGANRAQDRQRRFQALIQGEYKQEFEAAVGQRIRAAIQQRFRNRQEAARQPEAVQRQSGQSAMLRQHFARLVRQGEELRRSFPDFDLMEEMQNPAFVRLTAPGTGISVKDAFYAIHGEEIQRESMQYAARKAGDRIAASVQAGASRPLENGMQSLQPADMGVDIRNMDRQAREAYRRRIRNGETIDFQNRL